MISSGISGLLCVQSLKHFKPRFIEQEPREFNAKKIQDVFNDRIKLSHSVIIHLFYKKINFFRRCNGCVNILAAACQNQDL